ncbi:7-carboxy-7-deazaguanine synthase QueE [Porphyromonadaceae bacterium OttesenSCG-928-L07]|nr:7-carboxy-7-deazaguanine synthase QueE [Porphyromonadaceae bacterium OttesenSCG-928-L07]MDL2252356.1 7-carboxy-7-deazaguanine synthase QueE [Odoribacter sp. OttesenSCG-928-J03]MDL2331143.1 7-carboxy-7-deazaguanine synthase QueE [Odoribacter sp. OttesenSCG-928-A06]
MLSICEIYPCLQGEGSRAGVPSILIRTLGCNLRCTWCDTPYTSWKPEEGQFSASDILPVLNAHPHIREVILTGGEPTLCPEMEQIITLCTQYGKKITLETNGTRTLPVDLMKSIDLVSLSPKLSNSTPSEPQTVRQHHEKERISLSAIKEWMEYAVNYQLKFVVSEPKDLDEIEELIQTLQASRHNIYLMAEGKTEEELSRKRQWLADICIKKGFCYTERLHIVIYGDKRGV